jgi:predicted HTH domain antitoxin
MKDNKTASRQLNIRINSDLERRLRDISEYEHEEKISKLARRLLWDATVRRQLEIALREYSDERVTGQRAAEMAGLTLSEFLHEAAKQGVSAPYTQDDVLKDIKAAVKILSRRETPQGKK